MNFESTFLLLVRRSNQIFDIIQGLFDAKKQITIKIHIKSSKYYEKIPSENHLNRLKIRPQWMMAGQLKRKCIKFETVVVLAAAAGWWRRRSRRHTGDLLKGPDEEELQRTNIDFSLSEPGLPY